MISITGRDKAACRELEEHLYELRTEFEELNYILDRLYEDYLSFELDEISPQRAFVMFYHAHMLGAVAVSLKAPLRDRLKALVAASKDENETEGGDQK